MVTIQRQRLRHLRLPKVSLINGGILLLCIVALVATTAIAFFKSFHLGQQPMSTSNIIPKSFLPTNDRCAYLQSRYGCIILPPELTNDIRLDIEEIKQARGADIPISYGNTHEAAMSLQGRDHAQNQDRGIIVSPFRIPSQKVRSRAGANKTDLMVAIYDGHGDDGHKVSQYLQNNLHERIADKLSTLYTWSDEIIKQALNETFLEMDRELPNDLGKTGGSTASVILRLGQKMFFANVGDSLSFLAKYDDINDETSILYKNRFDKPHLPEEKERIERMGGRVFIPQFPINSRVIAFDRIRHEMVTLGMSRAIGDWFHGEVGVIAEPIVDVIDLDDVIQQNPNAQFFVVSSCDGLYDHRDKEFVAKRFANCFFQEQDCHPVVRSVNVIDLAIPKRITGYHDDMTVMAVRLQL